MSAELTSDLTGPPSSPTNPFASSPTAYLSPTASHACYCKQCGRLWTDSLSNFESDNESSDNGSPSASMGKRVRPRTTSEKVEALLEMFRSSYLQVDELLSQIYENRARALYRQRWRQIEQWFIAFAGKGLFGEKVLKDWLLRGGGEALPRIYQAELDAIFETTAFGRFNTCDWSVENPSMATKALQSLGPTVETQAPLLTSFLRALSSQKHKHVDRRQIGIGAPQLMIINILGHCRQRNTATNIPSILGLYLLRGGLRRRCLDTLNHFGIIVSYKVLLQKQKEIQDQAVVEVCRLGRNPASVISWDNFEYQDDRRSERVKEPEDFNLSLL